MENKKVQRKKILFVCTGNTCRSPMAEAAMRRELRRKKLSGYSVQSAGLHAETGAGLSPNSAQALAEAKIPVNKSFRPRQLTERMIGEALVVVCMTESQARSLGERPNVTSFAALCGMEIPDPYGRGMDVYRVTLRKIRECIPRIVELYCPPVSRETVDKKQKN